jgi:hypothetical protein
MPEILIFEPHQAGGRGLDPGPRRGFLAATGRFVRTVATILGCFGLGVGLAMGGYDIAASSSGTLTSSDKELLQRIAADHPADALDPFASRRHLPQVVTPEDSLYGEKINALLGYSFGLTMALLSLAVFAGCWLLTGNALGFYRRGVY